YPFLIVISARNHGNLVELATGKSLSRRLWQYGSIDKEVNRPGRCQSHRGSRHGSQAGGGIGRPATSDLRCDLIPGRNKWGAKRFSRGQRNDVVEVRLKFEVGATLRDRRTEQSFRGGRHKIAVNALSAGGLPKNRHSPGVAPESGDI